MDDPQTVDYDALAKQYGATSSTPPPSQGATPPQSGQASWRSPRPVRSISTTTPVTPRSPSWRTAPTAPAQPATPSTPDYDALAKQYGATSSAPPSSASPAAQPPEQPGFWERAYETSGLKGIVDASKAKQQMDEAAGKEIMAHVKAGRWGHATEALLKHVVGPAALEGALGPGGEFLKGVGTSTYQHSNQAADAVKRGDIKEAIAQGAEAVPVVGQIAEQVGEPLGRDVREKNWSGTAGDMAGGAASLLALRGGTKEAAATPEVAAPIEGAPLAVGEANPGLARGATKLLSKTGTAEKPMGRFMGERTAAISDAAKSLTPSATSPEATGSAVQGAVRDVLDKQRQAQSLVDDMATRAKQTSEQARGAATTQAGTAAQAAASKSLDSLRTASIEGGKRIARDLSGVDELPIRETDREIITRLREANDTARTEESAAHNALSEAAKDKGITVKTQPMQDVARETVNLEGPAKDLVMSSLPAGVYKTLEKISSNALVDDDLVRVRARDFGWDPDNLSDQQLKTVKDDIADNPHVASDPDAVKEVPYQVMKTARTAVGEALQSARKHFQQTGMGSNAQRVLQKLYGGMTDAMRDSLADDEDLSAQFDKANNLTRGASSQRCGLRWSAFCLPTT